MINELIIILRPLGCGFAPKVGVVMSVLETDEAFELVHQGFIILRPQRKQLIGSEPVRYADKHPQNVYFPRCAGPRQVEYKDPGLIKQNLLRDSRMPLTRCAIHTEAPAFFETLLVYLVNE